MLFQMEEACLRACVGDVICESRPPPHRRMEEEEEEEDDRRTKKRVKREVKKKARTKHTRTHARTHFLAFVSVYLSLSSSRDCSFVYAQFAGVKRKKASGKQPAPKWHRRDGDRKEEEEKRGTRKFIDEFFPSLFY